MEQYGQQQSREKTFLSRLPNKNWGYVIYRTVYAPESDRAWDVVVSKLEAYMLREVDKSLWEWEEPPTAQYEIVFGRQKEAPDPSLNTTICKQLKNRIMGDQTKLDGCSLEAVRSLFCHFPGPGEYIPNKDICVVIDEEAF